MKKIFTIFAAMLLTVAVNATTPSTNFAAPGYALTGTAAILDDGLLKETHFGEDRAYIRYDGGNHGFAAASWTINVTRGCYVTAKVFTADNDWSSSSSPWGHSGHSFGVELWNEDATVRLDTVAEGPYALGGDGNRNYPAEGIDLNNKGTLLIPTAGVYTFKLLNPRYWSRCGVDSVLLTYSADAPTEIIAVTAVELDKTELALQVEEVEQLTATVTPDNATDKTVTWTSSNESVATVDNGFVTAIAAGTATITAKAGDNKTATCAVTVSAVSIPEVAVTSTYTLEAKIAHIEGKIGKKYEGGKYKIYGKGNQVCGNAFWTIRITNPCILSASIANANGDGAGSLYELDVFKGEDSITTVIQPVASKWWSGLIDMDGTITLAEAGNYTFRLRNVQEYSVGKTSGIMLSYIDDARTVYLKPGVWNTNPATPVKYAMWCFNGTESDTWSDFMELVDADADIYATTIPAAYSTVIFARINGTWDTPDWSYNKTANISFTSGKDMYVISGWDDGSEYHLSTGYWKKYNPILEDAYYLIGIINGVEGWNEEDLTAARKFTADASAEVEDRMSVTAKLVSSDRIKAVYVENKEIKYWYPNDGNGWIIDGDHTGDPQTVYLSPDGNGGAGWLNTVLFVPDNSTTSLDNVNAFDKAVKTIENGQLVIIKNGVRYNVLGTAVR